MKFTVICAVVIAAVVTVMYLSDQPSQDTRNYRPSQAPSKSNSIKIY